jgi:hypothetical protein
LDTVEQTDEVDAVVTALRGGTASIDWVRLYSANGKHGSQSRRDPGRSDDRAV